MPVSEREGRKALGAVEIGWFAQKRATARRRYLLFVEEGIEQGRRPDLIGGGLLRSHGGWTGVKALRAAGSYQKGDERILGKGDFVAQVLSVSQEKLERKYRLAASGYTLDRLIERVAELFEISTEELTSPGKARQRVEARSVVCYWASTELGISQTQLANLLPLKQPAVINAVIGVLVWYESGNTRLNARNNKIMYPYPIPSPKPQGLVQQEDCPPLRHDELLL